jgi:hypothetical protein
MFGMTDVPMTLIWSARMIFTCWKDTPNPVSPHSWSESIKNKAWILKTEAPQNTGRYLDLWEAPG